MNVCKIADVRAFSRSGRPSAFQGILATLIHQVHSCIPPRAFLFCFSPRQMQPDLCLPHTTGRPLNLPCFCPQISAARYFFNTKTFRYRPSQSRRESALLLELLVSCITQILLQLLLPHSPCSLQRSRSQWQRHCSAAPSVQSSQLSATHRTSSPMSALRVTYQTSTSFKCEVIKKSVPVTNLEPTTNGISNMISAVCCRSECFRKNLKRLPNEEGLPRHRRKSRKRVQSSWELLHWKVDLLQ
jgi:hypothetical protein